MQLKIVYLDDEPDLCEMFKDNFESPNISILTFSEASLAINEIKENTPDLIFLDHRLPGSSGEEVAKQLDPQIPKFLITGDIETMHSSQFIKVFHKPYNFEEIESLLQKSISKKIAA